MDADKIRNRMHKLLALARRGEGGEKDNAQRFLNRMLSQHGMTIADLDDEGEQTEYVEFKYKGDIERRLLVQVISTVLQKSRFNVYQARSKLGLDVTRVQRLEIEMYFATYSAELEKSVNRMFLAFLVTNGITGPKDNEEDGEPSKLTQEDIDAIRRMMGSIDKTDVRRAIAHSKG